MRRAGWVAAFVLVAGLSLWQVVEWVGQVRDDAARDAAVDVAVAQALDLTTMDSSSVDAKLKRLASRTVGDFKEQFGEITDVFVSLVRDQKIEAVGVEDAVAVEEIDDDRASVIVASSATITDEKTTEPVVRSYRFRVDLRRQGGDWKVGGMEFIQ